MRARGWRAAERVVAHLVLEGQLSDPRALARLIANAVGTSGCELTLLGTRHRWGSEDGSWLSHPVWFDDERLGALALPAGSVDAAEADQTVRAVAQVLGPAFTELCLTLETDRLRREGDVAARQLADEQWRAAVEMEQERRTLERDLHDGAQHHLVALRMALALVEHADAASPDALDDLLHRLDAAERVLLDTAAGILPLALEDGLAVALAADLGVHEDVTLALAELRSRYPLSVESAVYFACLEAVNNAHKYAAGSGITVTVRDGQSGLEFRVADSGPGFAGPVSGSGLRNLSTRIEAVGGSVRVHSTPGHGTTVIGFVPR